MQAVVCRPMPMIFYAHHCDTLVWVATKLDKLLKSTLSRISCFGCPEIPLLITRFLTRYAIVIHTHSPRVTYADVFIVDDMDMVMLGIGATLFVKHPYEADVMYLIKMESVFGPLEQFGIFGNNRIYQTMTVNGLANAVDECKAQ